MTALQSEGGVTPDPVPGTGLKLAIIGSRNYPLKDMVARYVEQLDVTSVVVTGGWQARSGAYTVVEATPGVDREAFKAAEAHGLVTVLVTGSRTKYGRFAGVQRNPTIVRVCDALTAFWDFESRGTARTLKEAVSCGKQALVIDSSGRQWPYESWVARVDHVLRMK